MPHKKSTLSRHSQRFLSLGAMLMVVVAVGFYGMQLLTSHADTGAYYSCNSGDTLSGSTCTHASTYSATYHASYPYCSGSDTYYSSSGNCAYPATATPHYSCNSGDTLSGSTCTHTVSATCNWSGSSCSCPSGYTQSFRTCSKTYNATLTYTYSCRNSTDGFNPNTGYCYYPAYTSPAYYSCNNGDTLNGSTCTHTTTYTATYHPATTTPTSGTTTSGSTSNTTTTSTRSTSKAGSQTPVVVTPTQPPGAPTNFTAGVKSSKIVELSWAAGNAPAGIKEYDLDRSVDNTTWVPQTTTTDTSYEDLYTDFNATYYYRVRAQDNNGVFSDYATARVKTSKFSSSSNTITSDDKLVSVSIPSGAFDRDVSCSVSQPSDNLPSVPTKLLLVGPYDILCVDNSGTIIGTFKKPLVVTMNLSKASSGYSGFEARTFDDSSSGVAKSTFDTKSRNIRFSLTAAKSFAAYGVKQKSALGTVFEVFLLLLLLAGVGVGGLYLRRYWASRPTAAMAAAGAGMPSAEAAFEQAALKPGCTHLNMAHQVQPQSAGCAECTAEHKHWKGLRICLTCGHVGCSDDSDEQHALKHYQQTGHPLIYEYGNPTGDSIGWCYIDQTYI